MGKKLNYIQLLWLSDTSRNFLLEYEFNGKKNLFKYFYSNDLKKDDRPNRTFRGKF